MNILIVDDDIFFVEDVKRSMDWAALGIQQVFTAHSMRQAQQILLNQSIQILLSDIEMPKGSGLDLLIWVREQNLQTVNIFLTGHASFMYANQAIKLGGFDYILKPAPYQELEDVLKKAVQKVNIQRVYTEYTQQAQYWTENRTHIAGQFWREILRGDLPPVDLKIAAEAAYRHVAYSAENLCFPILVSINEMNQRADEWGRSLFDYAFKNIASEILLPEQEAPVIVALDKNLFVVLDLCSPANLRPVQVIAERCRTLVTYGGTYLPCTLSCYIDRYVAPEKLCKVTEQLLKLKNNNVVNDSRVLVMGQSSVSGIPYSPPAMEEWFTWILENRKDQVLEAVGHYLNHLVSSNQVDAYVLRQFHHDFMQGMYVVLNQKGILAHSIFTDSEWAELQDESFSSVTAMEKWIGLIVGKAADYAYSVEKTSSVVDRVKQYIRQNLNEEINRSALAAHVYLNPEYLSHIFKKKTGISLSDYINGERIREAQRLLVTSDAPIRDIALQAGYGNLAYFSKIFKKITGKTPVEYRGSVQC
ncbi:response regulator transcription factor [Paenibacillus donghaensis]|uniref:DNA-binding response regulator n=1 Tax=Paenibacillus donghaensis TaxID=414771 RepID=A0A2Z2KCR7_9BACL|nr:helix-turn-helix domain-containing protein [Paenibacillus donghaensis]ASA19759.1 hypothetical protein B9T62_02395 [Paenibacillus donghaensis]